MLSNKITLRQELDRLRDAYFNGEAEVTDAEYDALKRQYERMTGEKYTPVGAPVRPRKTVKGAITRGKVRLPYFMGSVKAKLKGDSAQKGLNRYAAKYPGPWIVADKLDGNAGQYILKPNSQKLYSKGDGLEGEDMSDILPYLSLPVPEGKSVIRGELVFSKSHFKEYAEAHKDDGSGRKLTCSRNAGSGILTSSKHDSETLSKFVFVAFQIQSETLSTLEHYEKLQGLGFQVPEYRIVDTLDAAELDKMLKEAEEESAFDIDGLVISPAHTSYEFPIDSNPKHMLAFKVDTCEVVEVLKVRWNVSSKGILVPNIEYEPIVLCGATCRKAKGHNAKFILTQRIGPGSQVMICKAGNIIPHIVRTITSCQKLELPNCVYVWDKNETNFLLVDPEDDQDFQIQQMVHFVVHMKIDGLQKTRITTLYENGINTIDKLLTVTKQELIECERIGSDLAQTILDNIHEKVNPANLVHVMVASNIFGMGFGEKKISKIVKAYPNILDYSGEDPGFITEMLNKLGGFVKMAVVFEARLPLFLDWLENHPTIVLDDVVPEEEIVTNESLKGEVVVFSGFTNRVLEAKIQECSGEYKKAVSNRTTILVAKDPTKSTNKVNKLGQHARLISLADFLAEYGFEL
jgi:NAD-dependent DNA ligase